MAEPYLETCKQKSKFLLTPVSTLLYNHCGVIRDKKNCSFKHDFLCLENAECLRIWLLPEVSQKMSCKLGCKVAQTGNLSHSSSLLEGKGFCNDFLRVSG